VGTLQYCRGQVCGGGRGGGLRSLISRHIMASDQFLPPPPNPPVPPPAVLQGGEGGYGGYGGYGIK